MERIHTIVIGGGQAGLAMSYCLGNLGIEHVVLERGQVAHSWRTERWDSLRLLTPRWQSRLPGWRYTGPDPDGYMSMAEVVAYLDGYARSLPAPVQEQTTVLSVEPAGEGYHVATDRGSWRCDNVVIATGACSAPHLPAFAAALPGSIHQLAPTAYRRPEELPAGGVLVVGAAASGIQLADELQRSGRPVTLSVGRHARMPRRYRGADIMWWLDQAGVLDRRAEDVPDLEAARRQPSLQLVGREDHASLDLAVLRDRGVRLVGRVAGVEGPRVALAGDLADTVAEADAGLARLRARIDAFVEAWQLPVPPPEPVAPVDLGAAPDGPRTIDLAAERIETVVWATGFRPRYPWLRVPVLDECGRIRHDGGVTAAPGLYVLGLPFLRRRKSTFIDGVGDDARALANHLAARARVERALAA